MRARGEVNGKGNVSSLSGKNVFSHGHDADHQGLSQCTNVTAISLIYRFLSPLIATVVQVRP